MSKGKRALTKGGTALAAGLVLLAAGCSPQTPPATGAAPLAKGHAFVNVDNGSPDEWEMEIDGKKSGGVKPYSIEVFQIRKGKHTFVVLRGGAPVDTIEAEIPLGKVTVLNPQGSNTYERMTVTYTTGGPFSGAGPSFEVLSSQRVVQVDFGLTDPLQTTIMIQYKKPSFLGFKMPSAAPKTETRTKLCKRLSLDMSCGEAIALLTGNRNAYYTDSQQGRELSVAAIKAIEQAKKGPELRDLLLKIVDAPKVEEMDQDRVVEAAVKALKPYETEIPQDTLTKWLMAPCDKSHGASAFRVQQAGRILMTRGKETSVLEQFGKLPEVNRECILRGGVHTNVPLAVRQQLVLAAVQNGCAATDAEMRRVIQGVDFQMDNALSKALDAYIRGLPADSHQDKARRESLERAWLSKVNSNRATGDVEAWVDERLLQFSRHEDKGLAYEAVRLLVQRDSGGILSTNLAPLTAAMRKYAIGMVLHRCTQEQKMVVGALDICRAGFQDGDAGIRLHTFEHLAGAQGYCKDPAADAMLREAVEKESDPGNKRRMGQYAEYAPATAKDPTGRKEKTSSSSASKRPEKKAKAEAPPPPAKAADGWPELAVSGISNTKGQLAALINKRIVFEGETISGVKIVAITRQGVTVSYKGETRVLPVRGGK